MFLTVLRRVIVVNTMVDGRKCGRGRNSCWSSRCIYRWKLHCDRCVQMMVVFILRSQLCQAHAHVHYIDSVKMPNTLILHSSWKDIFAVVRRRGKGGKLRLSSVEESVWSVKACIMPANPSTGIETRLEIKMLKKNTHTHEEIHICQKIRFNVCRIDEYFFLERRALNSCALSLSLSGAPAFVHLRFSVVCKTFFHKLFLKRIPDVKYKCLWGLKSPGGPVFKSKVFNVLANASLHWWTECLQCIRQTQSVPSGL